MYTTPCYLSYLALALGATVFVARSLHKNGRVFLVEAFHGNTELADSVNHLLVVGFYLLNSGWIMWAVDSAAAIPTPEQALQTICQKLGSALLTLGGVHMFNLYVLNRMRVRAKVTAA